MWHVLEGVKKTSNRLEKPRAIALRLRRAAQILAIKQHLLLNLFYRSIVRLTIKTSTEDVNFISLLASTKQILCF